MPFIKPEPQEQHALPLADSSAWRSNAGIDPRATTLVKPETRDSNQILSDACATSPPLNSAPALPNVKPESAVPQNGGQGTVANPEPPRAFYKVYASPDDIQYVPEDALKEGLGMVERIKGNIKKLELGSKLRKDVWLREIESLQSQGAPTTMIAVCGATGAGKSSVLNAILDDNIVPTSGMRACTSVVTEIGYHTKRTIDADVSFLSETEWREELVVLQHDMVDEDGKVKRSTDMRTEAGVAWSKVHAVYPSIIPEQFVKMTIDQIISSDIKIKNILGTTKHITAKDPKTFGREIAKYIDSKDQKRGEKQKKSKEKKDTDKGKEKSLMDKIRAASGATHSTKYKDDLDGPALWPLIRGVGVRCQSPALSTGALLVDLPGVADSNAARNNIAKDYMKKCDCVWILAPITRAVDDKTARDLMGDAFKMQLMSSYDANAITFVASKCDDISCSEVIRALNLEDDPELVDIEEQISLCKDDTTEWKGKKADAEAAAKGQSYCASMWRERSYSLDVGIDTQLKEVRAYLAEYQEHLKALEEGRTFVPVLTAKSGKRETTSETPKKRKNTGGEKKGTSKKRKTSGDGEDGEDDLIVVDDADEDEEEDIMDVEDELVFSDSDSDKQSDDEKDDDDSSDNSDSESAEDSEEEQEDDDNEAEEVTVESLQAKIGEAKDAIKAGRLQLSEFRKQRKEASDMLANIKKKQLKAQREKNAFCSLKRSEFSRDVLKEDFRTGLKELDDAAAEQRDPDSFDPTVNLRNYDEIDLPVFTCSARDYVRLKGQVKGDGDSTCFSKVEDTGIPELQKWCHQLTVSSRERAARNFLTHLRTFANSVRMYVQGIGDVTVSDREAMREKWESIAADDSSALDHDDPAYGFLMDDELDMAFRGMYSLNEQATKVDRQGNAAGVAPRLTKDFETVVKSCVEELKACFREGLEEKCAAGAINAANAAIDTSDTFATSMHWATYRATLRRDGAWRRDLNVELSNPLTRNIASSWSKVFESDLFASFEKATLDAINKLLAEVEESAAIGLKERARGQAELCLEDARVALQKTLDVVRDTMNTQQKEASRSFAPEVQTQLREGYRDAMEERGIGSVARQKAVFRNFLASVRDHVFTDAASVLLKSLVGAADAVGEALNKSLAELAQKIEVSIAVLWEGPRDDPSQMKVRAQVVATMTEIMEQVQMWVDAGRNKTVDA
ncbi:Dynamin family-domain-containing protein [Sparassis latifolia]